jgi:hypothetical protein
MQRGGQSPPLAKLSEGMRLKAACLSVARGTRAQLAASPIRTNHPANESENQTHRKKFPAFRRRNNPDAICMNNAVSSALRAALQIRCGQ